MRDQWTEAMIGLASAGEDAKTPDKSAARDRAVADIYDYRQRRGVSITGAEQ